MSIREDLTRLVELQAAEIARRKLEAEVGALPAERARLRQQIEAARTAVSSQETRRDENLKARRKLEGDLQTAEAQLDKYREQEMLVKRNEELWAIQKEMGGVQQKISDLEEGILESMEAADTAAQQIEAAKAEAARVETEVETEIAQVDVRQRELESELEQLRGEIERIRAATEDETVAMFDRIAGVRGGVGIAEMVDGGCAACQVRQRPQLALEVVKMLELRRCEACKRILFARDALELPSDVSVVAE